MTNSYVDTNLCNFTDQIMDIWAARRTEKKYFPDSALSGKIGKDTLQKTTELKSSAQKTNGENPLATSDGKDDGKISFKEKMQNFGEGLVKPIKTIFSSPKNMLITAASVAGGAALIALTGGAAAPVMVAAGVVGGTVQVGKGIYKQVNAKTDNEAKQAWQEMGTGTFAVGVSAAGAKSSLKAAKVSASKDIPTSKAVWQCMAGIPKNIKTGIKNIYSKMPVKKVIATAPKQKVPDTGSFILNPMKIQGQSIPNVSQTSFVLPNPKESLALSQPKEVLLTLPSHKASLALPQPKPMLALPQPKVKLDYSFNNDKLVLPLSAEKLINNSAAKPKVLALPEPPKRLALPEPKIITSNKKLGILSKLKKFLNVFGLFLPKNK